MTFMFIIVLFKRQRGKKRGIDGRKVGERNKTESAPIHRLTPLISEGVGRRPELDSSY